MSYSQRPASKMHCKVCESAKKSPSIIASHFPKNRDGKTVCPTLLAQQCRGCGVKGHTISYCTIKETPIKPTVCTIKVKETKPKETNKPTTAYDSLYMSDDDEEEVVVVVIQAPKEPTKKKKESKDKGPAKKFCWATAESDSSGSEEEEDSD